MCPERCILLSTTEWFLLNPLRRSAYIEVASLLCGRQPWMDVCVVFVCVCTVLVVFSCSQCGQFRCEFRSRAFENQAAYTHRYTVVLHCCVYNSSTRRIIYEYCRCGWEPVRSCILRSITGMYQQQKAHLFLFGMLSSLFTAVVQEQVYYCCMIGRITTQAAVSCDCKILIYQKTAICMVSMSKYIHQI